MSEDVMGQALALLGETVYSAAASAYTARRAFYRAARDEAERRACALRAALEAKP